MIGARPAVPSACKLLYDASFGEGVMQSVLLVFFGGGLGAALRHGVNLGCARLCGTGLPWGTFNVNIAGSFAMGLIVGWFAFRAGEEHGQHARLFLTTGVLGGFTTFSAFSLDCVLLWERGETALAIGYAAASVALSIGALAAGLTLIRALP